MKMLLIFKNPNVMMRIILGLLVASFLAISFGNCSEDNRFSLTSMSSSEVSRETEGGGDGYGFGGKPDGQYNRYLPEFSCDGTAKEYTSIFISDGKIIFRQNDVYQCDMKTTEIAFEDLDISKFQKEIFGYQEGIYQYLQQNSSQAIPSTLVEVWCQSRESSGKGLEVIVKFNTELAKAEARIYYEKWDEARSQYAPRVVSDFEVSRLSSDHRIIIKSAGLELEVDRDKLSPGDFGQFEGQFQANIDSVLRSETIDCRLGGNFDPSIWPAKNFSQVEVNSLVKLSSNSSNVPHWYGFFSIDPKDVTNSFRKEIYLFSDEQKNPEKIGFVGPEEASGFKYFKFSPDGRYIYYRADSQKAKFFQLYQMDLKTKSKRLIHASGSLNGHGTLSTFEGGFSLYSDGTLVFINQEGPSFAKMNLYVVPGNDPLAEPLIIPSASIAGQSLGYLYSSINKTVLFVESTLRDGKIEYRIKSFDTKKTEESELFSLSKENLSYPIFGITFNEVGDYLPYELILRDSLGSFIKETSIFNLLSRKNISLGSNLNNKIYNSLFSQVIFDDAEGVLHTDFNSMKQKKYPLARALVFSKNSETLWWEANGSLSSSSFVYGDYKVISLASAEKVLKLLPLGEEGVAVIVYNGDLGIIKLFRCLVRSQCSQVNSIPFSLIEAEGFLDASLNPNEKMLALSVNMSFSDMDSTFMTYILPLDGSPAIAASALGLGPGNKEHGNRAQLFFSFDSKVLYFIGHGWKKSAEQNQSVIYSFKTPSYLIQGSGSL